MFKQGPGIAALNILFALSVIAGVIILLLGIYFLGRSFLDVIGIDNSFWCNPNEAWKDIADC